MILNPCFIDYAAKNIAETVTQPVDYFAFPTDVKKVPISRAVEHIDSTVSTIIAGGGGIAGPETWSHLRHIVDAAASTVPIVVWGMGINDHGRLDRQYDPTLEYLETKQNVLIGLRDVFYSRHVPCASCMRPEFDSRFTTQFEIGFYTHHMFDIPTSYPTMSNRVYGDPLVCYWHVLQFLGSCDIVATNTYHGAYWATLLGRKVIVFAPFSNKFSGFKYEPVIVNNIRNVGRVSHLARAYPSALSECRAANVAFYSEVLAFLQS